MDNDYNGNDIQALSSCQAVRKRPRLYFQKCFDERNLDSLPFEVLCHAFDEYFDSNCKKIEIDVDDTSFTVTYNAGISLETNTNGITRAETIMTQIFACKNEKKHLAVGEEFCSLGMAVINFVSEKCELTTSCTKIKGHFIFKDGQLVSKVIDSNNNEKDFTKIYIKPDKMLFENLSFTYTGINEKATKITKRLNNLEIAVINNISRN